MNIILGLHNEVTFFRIATIILESKEPNDKFFVYDDYSDEPFISEVKDFCYKNNITLIQHHLNKNFSEHKNYMHNFINDNEYVLWCDSDEILDHQAIKELHRITKQHPDVEKIHMARINITYDGESRIMPIPEINWENPQGECYPDWSGRFYKKLPHIKWTGIVHECLTGARKEMHFKTKELSVIHYRSTAARVRSHILCVSINPNHPTYRGK